MRVPFPLSPALQEVMVFEEHAEDAEEIAAIIREVSPVPVVIRLMPTHAQSQWSSSTPQDLAMRRATSVLDRHIRPFWWPFYTALTALFDELEAEAPEGWGSAVTEEERAGVRENMGLRARLKTALRAVSGLNSMYGADDADEEALEVLETAFGAAEEAAAGLREKPRSAHLADIIDKMTAGRDPVMQAAREAVREAQMVSRTSQG